ncbi:MAG: SGNH/GDSL hydrolase family protein, partial [Cyanobacteria bacterium J06648_11]
MKVGILAIGFLGVMGMTPLAVEAASFSEVYEFGDSLLDTGNLFGLTSGPLPPGSPPPAAVPFPGPPYPSAPYFNGRFSNGPMWQEYVEQGLGIASDPSTNFAFGGALSGVSHSQFSAPLGLRSQVTGFTTTVGSADPDALYIISAGANDYGNPLVVTPQTITDAVTNISASIIDLASVGASSFLVLNIP